MPDDVITENKTNEINKNLIKTGEIKKRHFFVYQANDVCLVFHELWLIDMQAVT